LAHVDGFGKKSGLKAEHTYFFVASPEIFILKYSEGKIGGGMR
jgi:hypothetical protein